MRKLDKTKLRQSILNPKQVKKKKISLKVDDNGLSYTDRSPVKNTLQEIVFKRAGGFVSIDKVELFTREFMANGGDATKAALSVEEFDTPERARSAGHYYLTKAKERGLFRQIFEKEGYTLNKFMLIALEKMEKSDKPDWWDRLMKMAGYDDFISKSSGGPKQTTVAVNIFDAHKQMNNEYIEAEEVTEDAAHGTQD